MAHETAQSAYELLAAGGAHQAVQKYLRAIELGQDLAKSYCNLGVALQMCDRWMDALRAHQRALQLQPDLAESWNGLADVLRGLGRAEQAVDATRRAVALASPRQRVHHSNLLLTINADPRVSLAESQAERRRWYEQHRLPGGAERRWRSPPGQDPERRLRIGYVSSDFWSHSAAHAFGAVILNHDRARFEVTCYAGGTLRDQMTDRFKLAAERWRDVADLSDEQLATQIAADGIDILVDLSGHTQGNRLRVFTTKPAPIQASGWGNISGTGIPEIDYLFADPVIVPQHERHLYAEQIVDLPCALGFVPPEYAPEVGPLPVLRNGVITFGCLNSFSKVSGQVLELWSRILRSMPGARLILKDAVFDDKEVAGAVAKQLLGYGLDLRHGQVVALGKSPRADHLAVYNEIDIALDPFPHNGGVSTLEALWMGVPVVTLCGDRPCARMTTSILSTLGLDNGEGGLTAAWCPDDYALRAMLGVAANRKLLRDLRATLRDRLRDSPIVKPGAYVGAVERAYRAMWRSWCTDTPIHARNPVLTTETA